jgi:hypothetical protein
MYETHRKDDFENAPARGRFREMAPFVFLDAWSTSHTTS